MAVVLEGGQADALLYYELHLETAGLHQVGQANLKDFKPNTKTGDGTGDDGASYAIDASRLLKFNDGKEEAYGSTAAKAGDILGCLYDTKAKALPYSLNGKALGVAFTLDEAVALVPSLRANQSEILDLWLKKEQMKHIPKGATAIMANRSEKVFGTFDCFVYAQRLRAKDPFL